MSNLALQFQTRVRSWTSSIPIVIWTLLVGGLINSIGTSFLWPLNSLYIHTVLGKSLTTAGVVLMLMNGAGVLGNLVGGALFDRIGGKPVIVTGLLSSAGFVISLGFTHSWPLFVTFMVLLGFTQSMVMPSLQALVGQLWPEGGRRAFNLFYVVNNLGVAIGTALGGLLAEVSFLLVFLLNGVSYLLYVAFFLYGLRNKQQSGLDQFPVGHTALARNQSAVSGPTPSIVIPVAFLSVGIMISWIAYSQWAGSIAVFTKEAGYSLSSYSFLWTLNGILIVLGQPFLIQVLKRFTQRISVQIVAGGILYTAAFVLISVWPTYSGFLLGMTVLTIGEMIILPGVPAAINLLAPKERLGFYQGIAASSGTAGRMLGPVLGGIVYDTHGAIPLFILASVACLVATVSFIGFYASTRSRML